MPDKGKYRASEKRASRSRPPADRTRPSGDAGSSQARTTTVPPVRDESRHSLNEPSYGRPSAVNQAVQVFQYSGNTPRAATETRNCGTDQATAVYYTADSQRGSHGSSVGSATSATYTLPSAQTSPSTVGSADAYATSQCPPSYGYGHHDHEKSGYQTVQNTTYVPGDSADGYSGQPLQYDNHSHQKQGLESSFSSVDVEIDSSR
jgi:hypothetical protein